MRSKTIAKTDFIEGARSAVLTALDTQENDMALILNQSQAEAVYSAMCALNNVGGRADAFIEGVTTNIHARELHDGRVVVHEIPHDVPKSDTSTEMYDNQAAFATAYGLNPDEPQSAVAAAAGGLTQVAIER